jgi:uncharacterized protein (DUF362 family)
VRRFWDLLVNNRIAIALASLVWLGLRSGSQPRRLVYPCQQAAFLNLTAITATLLPALFLSRKPKCPQAVGRVVMVRRQLLVAVLLLSAGFFGFEGYQYAETLVPATKPDVPLDATDATPATVSVVHASQVPVVSAEVETMVQEAVALVGGLDDVVSPGDQVVLKLNLVMSGFYPGEGITTDPRVARAMVRLCQQAGAGEVILADGAGGGTGGRDVTKYAFRDAGYDSNMDMIDDETGVQLVDLNEAGALWPATPDPDKVTLVSIPNGVLRTEYYVPNLILDCDVLISVPLIKNHWNTAITGALKNRIGCAPADIYHSSGGTQSKQSVAHLVDAGFPRNVSGQYPVPPATSVGNKIAHYTTVDLNLVRPNDFVLFDGLVGNTDGPIGQDQPNPYMGLIMASRDSVAADAVETLIMGYDPTYIEHIAWANERGLGTLDTAYITVVGDSVMSVRQDFPLGHGGAGITSRADQTPPTINGISLTEGQRVAGTINLSGSDFGDNAGVVKGELLVDGEFVTTLAYPSDPFTFVWDTSGLDTGQYTVTLRVYDAALNHGEITRQVLVSDYSLADFDEDDDVDSQDYGRFQCCVTGTALGPPEPGCEHADLDFDGDVDNADHAKFMNCFSQSGPNVPVDMYCAD